MNKYEILVANVKTYVMLAKTTKSVVYTKAAKDSLNKLKQALNDDKTKTMKINLTENKN